eukprot:7160139-Pyramimonas_sp.AAC.1
MADRTLDKRKDVRGAIRGFPLKTASGQTRIAPRTLDALSDQALQSLADMFMPFESWLAWPTDRLYSEL